MKKLGAIVCIVLFGIMFNGCTKTETAKKDPVITWSNPADISFGTLLSANQLNATADIAGTFVYTPPIGSKPNEGANQDLKVDFTPIDIATYNVASKIVKINITKATTVNDIEGNVYKIVTIGTQVWMAENLKTTQYSNGDQIANVMDATAWATSTGGYCWYNNDATSYKATYGALYNWKAIDLASNGGKNICPTGWHIPTDAEWTTLTTTLGGESVAGGKMKESGTAHWTSPNTGATNESGFSALPTGVRYGANGFKWVGTSGSFWSSTSSDASNAWRRNIGNVGANVGRGIDDKQTGISVRCVKD